MQNTLKAAVITLQVVREGGLKSLRATRIGATSCCYCCSQGNTFSVRNENQFLKCIILHYTFLWTSIWFDHSVKSLASWSDWEVPMRDGGRGERKRQREKKINRLLVKEKDYSMTLFMLTSKPTSLSHKLIKRLLCSPTLRGGLQNCSAFISDNSAHS